MSVPMYVVDAFSDRPFAGNPAAVCLLDEAPNEQWMQSVAAEMNLSETAFVMPREDDFDLRWFTPKVEVRLCGHATLASAHALWELARVPAADHIRFHTASGVLTAARRGDGIIELDFPARPLDMVQAPAGLAEALGAEPLEVGRSTDDLLVRLANSDAVRRLEPDIAALGMLPVRGTIVTAVGDSPGIDFVSRFFAPAVGIAEDPVTGSAHCCLAPFWAERLGRTTLTGHQASARGGTVATRLDGDRVVLGGRAATVLVGEMRADAGFA